MSSRELSEWAQLYRVEKEENARSADVVTRGL